MNAKNAERPFLKRELLGNTSEPIAETSHLLVLIAIRFSHKAADFKPISERILARSPTDVKTVVGSLRREAT